MPRRRPRTDVSTRIHGRADPTRHGRPREVTYEPPSASPTSPPTAFAGVASAAASASISSALADPIPTFAVPASVPLAPSTAPLFLPAKATLYGFRRMGRASTMTGVNLQWTHHDSADGTNGPALECVSGGRRAGFVNGHKA